MKRCIIFAAMLSLAAATFAQKSAAPAGGKAISTDLFGIFFEDINYAGDGGLYAEMVQNRSFEYTASEHEGWGPMTAWKFVNYGHSVGDADVVTNRPLHANNTHYVTLRSEVVGLYRKDSPIAGIGLQNEGYDGMALTKGEIYHFSIWARGEMPLQVVLQDGKGLSICSDTIRTAAVEWQCYEAVLRPDTTLTDGRLSVLAIAPGQVDVDMISLFPHHTYKERKGGLRADMVEALQQLKPRFMRFPGGCLLHGPGLEHLYNWKNTVGPVWQRKGQPNCWGYHQSQGIGYYEFFQMCEDLGCKPVPVIHAGVTCQGDAKGWNIPGTGQRSLTREQMEAYVQDILDMIEWATGPADSRWGRLRAEAGHPAPFQLEYIAIGNEENVTDSLIRNLTMLYEAIHECYPQLTVIGTCGHTANGHHHNRGWQLARDLGLKVVDEHYFQAPDWLIKNQHRYDSYDRTGPQVYFGEYGSRGTRLFNALAEAIYMMGLERNGDIVCMASYAPLFGKRDHCQWNPDLIYFDNQQLYPSVSYYVQQLFSTNSGDYYYDDVINAADDPMLGRSCVFDSRTGDVILKFSNADSVAKTVTVDLSRFKRISSKVAVTTLTGHPEDTNNYNQAPLRPRTESSQLKCRQSLTIEPYTFQVIRYKAK
ncbi:MAG: alpha-N-arabinofuranosidase [Bacteroidaceae bacterium]|nr:alpha-N-arabinofuranosidase [Bacteroidaceae bacterium]